MKRNREEASVGDGISDKCVAWARVLREFPRWFWILVGFFLVRGVLWAVLIPPFQAPDEQVHFAGIYDFYINNSNPWSPSRGYDARVQMLGHYSGFAEQRFRPFARRSFAFESTEGPNEEAIRGLPRKMGSGMKMNYAVAHPPFYYWLSSFPLRLLPSESPIHQLFYSRLLSVFLGIVGLWFVYLSSRELLPDREEWQSYLTVFFAFIPMMTFVSSVVTPDAYANAVVCFFFWTLLQWINRPHGKRSTYWLVLSLLLLITTKKNMYFLIPYGLAAVLFISLKKGRVSWRHAVLLLIPLFCLGLFYVSYPGFKAFTLAYEMKIRNIPIRSIPLSQINILLIAKHLLWDNIAGYWGRFGWGETGYPEGIYMGFRVILYMALGASLLGVLARRTIQIQKDLLFILAVYVPMLFGFILVLNVYYLSEFGKMYGLGRHFLSAWFPHAVCVIVGLTWFLPEGLGRWAARLLCCAAIILNVGGLFLVILPRYYL